jgi:hypothetical protein
MGGGELGHDPERAMQFALNLDCLDAIVIGMEGEEQIDGNLDLLRRLEPAPV